MSGRTYPFHQAYTERCLVAPSPQLRARVRERLRSAGAGLDLMAGRRIALQPQNKPGFNDGLIVPGTEMPLGTPLRTARRAAATRAPLRGDIRVIIVLVDFVDAPMTRSADHFRDLFFSTGKIATGSVREYYTEVSHGLIAMTGDVVGPYRLPRTLAAYAGGGSGTDNPEPNARTMARDAAQLANPDVDFGPYDNDGNGFVDAFIVIHAGPGAEETGNANHIWSHKWVFVGGPFNADSTKIFAYLTVPEDSKIGVCAHELGHLVFGWPDLYDTDESSEGLGNWCLMAGGSWNGGGDTPAHPSAWCKAGQGWVTVENRVASGSLTIKDVKSSKKVYRFWKSGVASDEYFLAEHRRQTGYDTKLPGEGLLIYHIDDTVDDNSNENHPKVRLMEADNQNHLHDGVNRGDDGDVFPGRSANHTFDKGSSPGSKAYSGSETCVALTNIQRVSTNIKLKSKVTCASPASGRKTSGTARTAAPAGSAKKKTRKRASRGPRR